MTKLEREELAKSLRGFLLRKLGNELHFLQKRLRLLHSQFDKLRNKGKSTISVSSTKAKIGLLHNYKEAVYHDLKGTPRVKITNPDKLLKEAIINRMKEAFDLELHILMDVSVRDKE